MAEICLECWRKINGDKIKHRKYILSKDLDLCDECGEWKHVIIMSRNAYYRRKFRYIVLPLQTIYEIICSIIFFIVSLLTFPFRLLKEKLTKNKTD